MPADTRAPQTTDAGRCDRIEVVISVTVPGVPEVTFVRRISAAQWLDQPKASRSIADAVDHAMAAAFKVRSNDCGR